MCDILDELCGLEDAMEFAQLEMISQVKQKVLEVCKRLPVYN